MFFTVPLRQALQGFERAHHLQEVGVGEGGFVLCGQRADHEVADAAAIEVCHVAMTIAHLGAEGKEESGFGKDQRAAVCQQPFDLGCAVSEVTGTDERGDVFYGVSHFLLFESDIL